MAVTSIWAVKGWLGKVVIYVENPDKTENPDYYEKQNMTAQQAESLSDVIDYAAEVGKTTEYGEMQRHYVYGINCEPATARSEMMAVKSHYGKSEGVVAYHGYQSFAPNEVMPEAAHEIGIKLAERLWGDRYQVLVATHLDKANHLHNHFVLNNVSMVDGKKYYRSKRDYFAMQRASDALCREYGLSVIDNAERRTAKHYGEWQADKNGEPTYRNLIKADVDRAIAASMTERQFWDNLKKMGYTIKFGQDITLRPQGRERGLKLRRNFGDEYTIERIVQRILSQDYPKRLPPERPKQYVRVSNTIRPKRRVTGLRALYFYYLYRIGALPKKREPNPKRVYFTLREDIRQMRNITLEARLLSVHHIDTAEQLLAYKQSQSDKLAVLSATRKQLYRELRRKDAQSDEVTIRADIAELSKQIGALRREVKLCEDIESRSEVMTDKLRKADQAEKSEVKEVRKDEPFRRRR